MAQSDGHDLPGPIDKGMLPYWITSIFSVIMIGTASSPEKFAGTAIKIQSKTPQTITDLAQHLFVAI
jgi:hypothetical protein